MNVSLRSIGGYYLCAEGGGGRPLVANRREAHAWEHFEVIPVGPGRIALRAADGHFVCAEGGGGRELVANRRAIGPWETFTIVPLDDGRVALQADNAQFVCAEKGGGGAVTANRNIAGPWESWGPSLPLTEHAPRALDGRLRVERRFFVNNAGTFRPVFASLLSPLRPGRSDDDLRVLLDWVVSTGFNGIRVFAGHLSWAKQSAARARERLPLLLHEAMLRALYVEVTAITDSAVGSFDPRAHLADIAQTCLEFPNAIVEIANEPYHETQARDVHDPRRLDQWAASVVPPDVLCALGAAAEDESTQFAGGNAVDYVTVHLDRGRDKWNQVRRVRELEALSATVRKPVLNNEPIGADERAAAGRREDDPAFFFTLGVLNRLFEVGGVFHSEAGLQALLPGPVQQACADEFVAGSYALPTNERLLFRNANNLGSWPESPVREAAFERSVVRAYSGVAGNRAWTVLVGVTGDPQLELQNGWRVASVTAERAGVQVLELEREDGAR